MILFFFYTITRIIYKKSFDYTLTINVKKYRLLCIVAADVEFLNFIIEQLP